MKEKLSTLIELFGFLWEKKLWWLIPIIFVFVSFGVLILFVGSSPVAPIIYPLF